VIVIDEAARKRIRAVLLAEAVARRSAVPLLEIGVARPGHGEPRAASSALRREGRGDDVRQPGAWCLSLDSPGRP
jgi:hypothetical protein